MADSKFLNSITTDHVVQSRPFIPSDYHCTCDYCKNFMGDIFNNDSQKHYSNRIRNGYYVNKAGEHLDVGQMIGYRWAVQNLCPKDGWVFDPTVGTGTAIVEAINNGRNAIGIELEYPEVTQRNIDNQNSSNKVLFRQGNAKILDQYFEEWGIKKGSIDLVINGTPYPKMSGKSSDAPERKNLKTGEDKSFDYMHPDNMGLTKGDEYWDLVRTMYGKSIEYLKPGGYFVILIKDLVQNKTPYLLHKYIIDEVLKSSSDVEHYGFFTHLHCPQTLFQNTYPKKYPNIPIPFYQVGVVLRKKGRIEPGFPLDTTGQLRDLEKNYRTPSVWELDKTLKPVKKEKVVVPEISNDLELAKEEKTFSGGISIEDLKVSEYLRGYHNGYKDGILSKN